MTTASEQMTLNDTVTNRLLDALWDRLAAKALADAGDVRTPQNYLRSQRRILEARHGDTARDLLAADPNRSVNELEELLMRTRPPLRAAANRDPEPPLDRELGKRKVAAVRAILAGAGEVSS